MRTLIAALLLLPFAAFSQTPNVFIKLIDANGQLIKGESQYKSYEKQITALTLSTSGVNNSQVQFTMNVTPASGVLKNAMFNNTVLQNGLISVGQYGGGGVFSLQYTITMQNITVTQCVDQLGCNGAQSTTVVLSPGRIGWTYYQTDPSGKQSVSGKVGYDVVNGKAWQEF
jgi:type VI protein secretion system component Hcp